MVSRILLLIAVLLEDTVEGVKADDFAEGLQRDGFDLVSFEGRADLERDCLNIIDWHVNRLAVLFKLGACLRRQVTLLRGSFGMHVLLRVLVFLMMLLLHYHFIHTYAVLVSLLS